MPGKQMSIDADLNAGLINDDEARARRKKVEEEADFYGAMDGASKFVRGDAIAGIIITMINIVGGLIIGVLQNKMAIGDASRVYTLLTVGDGLVTQLPALIISTASGVIVTRAATGNKLGDEIIKQVMVQPRALGIASGIVIILGLVPGLPTLPFVLLAALMGMIAYLTQQSRKAREEQEVMMKDKEDALPVPENVVPLLHPDLLGLEVGYGLIPLVDSEKGGDLLGRIRAIRRQCAMEMGIIVPPLHIKDNFQLKSHEYTIMIKGMEVARGELMSNHLLAMDQGNVETEMEGIKTKEPTFGLPALWINDKDKEKAKLLGYTVVDHSTVVATHISEIMKGHAYELLGRQEVQELLDTLGEKYPKAVDELVPNLLTLGNVQKVLQNLLKERISIRDLLTIVEALADNAVVTKDVDMLTEAVRQAMSRTITRQYMEPGGTLPAIVIDQGLEEIIQGSLQKSEHGAYLALDPAVAQKILNSIKDTIEKLLIEGHQAVVLCSPVVRPYLKRLTERFLPKLAVMSYAEIEPETEIRSVGEVKLDEAVSTPTS
jgi:flagellar biosynthesis protein FlhA